MVTQNNPTKGSLKFLSEFYETYDGKRYTVGIEKGRRGTKHAQIRIEFSGNPEIEFIGFDEKKVKVDHFFEACRMNKAHCEKSENWSDYEGKDGFYITNNDTSEVRNQRFGKPTQLQQAVLNVLRNNNDRQVTVWYDAKGNSGKSWLTGHLWEKSQAHYVRLVGSAESMIKDVASKMTKQRRPIVVIDIPRAKEWNDEIYEAIEVIKDGLIDDPRYQANALNIRGTKVLVMTNRNPRLTKLSEDRWIKVGITNSKKPKFYTKKPDFQS